MAELGMVSLPIMFPVSSVQDAFDDDGNDLNGSYDRHVGRFIDEFEWYAEALKEKRKKSTPY